MKKENSHERLPFNSARGEHANTVGGEVFRKYKAFRHIVANACNRVPLFIFAVAVYSKIAPDCHHWMAFINWI